LLISAMEVPRVVKNKLLQTAFLAILSTGLALSVLIATTI